VVRAPTNLFTRRTSQLIHAIADSSQPWTAWTALQRVSTAAAHIGVSTSLAERLATEDDARPLQIALLDGQPELETSAFRGKTERLREQVTCWFISRAEKSSLPQAALLPPTCTGLIVVAIVHLN